MDMSVDEPRRDVRAARIENPGIGRKTLLDEPFFGEYVRYAAILDEHRAVFHAGVAGEQRRVVYAGQGHRIPPQKSTQDKYHISSHVLQQYFMNINNT
jgi:hypothetical protein